MEIGLGVPDPHVEDVVDANADETGTKVSPATARAINYAELVNDPEAMSAIWHTAFYTALFVPTSVILGLLIALALNRKIRFIGVYRTAIFVPFVASAAATGILANYIFDPQFRLRQQHPAIHRSAPRRALEDQRQAMIVIAVRSLWAGLGFTVVVYLAASRTFPRISWRPPASTARTPGRPFAT